MQIGDGHAGQRVAQHGIFPTLIQARDPVLLALSKFRATVETQLKTTQIQKRNFPDHFAIPEFKNLLILHSLHRMDHPNGYAKDLPAEQIRTLALLQEMTHFHSPVHSTPHQPPSHPDMDHHSISFQVRKNQRLVLPVRIQEQS